MARKSQLHLGARERQIMDAIHQLGDASVADVRERLANPPTYSAVRTMMRLLEQKGYLKHRQEATKYIYRSTQPLKRARRSALQHLLDTFFRGSASDAVAAMLDLSAQDLSPEEFDRLSRLINDARRETK
jgi:BlaI family transcriptional regulator, penicillinase repressor